MSKYVKQLIMDDLRQSLNGVRDLVVIDLKGVDAVSDNTMRLKLREKDIHVRVVRNNLARKVFSEAGFEGKDRHLSGPSAVAWGGTSVVELAKEIAVWAGKLEKLQIKGGVSDGQALSAAEVNVLSKLPSREEVLGQVVGRLLSPGANLVLLVQSPGGRLAGQIKARAEEGGDSAAAAESAA